MLPLILASASPRRRELLTSAGISFVVFPANIDETPLPDEEPAACALRIAESKCATVFERHPSSLVLAADTMVVADGLLLGKPVDRHDAVRMLRLLSGKEHDVLTAVAIRGPGGTHRLLERTAVRFRPLELTEITAYVVSGEPMDKAGAYAIQGGAASMVSYIQGSYSNVVGLPLAEVVCALREHGPRLCQSPDIPSSSAPLPPC